MSKPRDIIEKAHDLIKTGDPDATRPIIDRNGEVVLAYCRRCRRGEGELGPTCLGAKQ